MILFKACPRCAGDVDATYHDDVYCVQCAYRPAVAYPGPRVVEGPQGSQAAPERAVGLQSDAQADAAKGVGDMVSSASCPRCGSKEVVRLDRIRPNDNTCYRCRSCGHVFSPAEPKARPRPNAAVP